MSMKHYLAARKEGLKQQHAAQARGQDPYLPVLSELVPTLNKLTQVPLGLVQIALDQIEGTATKGRTTAFSRGFMPLLEPDSEFASKWSVLYDGIVEDGLRQPIVALEYYNRFYIVEGNKRVSVMRRLDAVSIEADVTRVLPEPEDSERYRVYQEFLSFYADTKINFITFTREGSYEKLYKLMGKTPGKKWSPEDLFDFQSCFYRFQQAYNAKAEGSAPMPACDALLIYLEVFGYEDSVEKTPAEFGQEIERIWSEFVVAAANKPAALLSQPTEAKPGFLQSVWHKPPQTVRCAFLYNRSPQDSGWSYWHELGRKALEDTFGSRVETVCRECVAQEDVYKRQGRNLALRDEMEEQRAQTCEQQRRGNGKASQRGHEHRRAEHGEHVLEAQNEQLRGAQRAGIADTLVLHGDISFVNMRFTRDRSPRISSIL